MNGRRRRPSSRLTADRVAWNCCRVGGTFVFLSPPGFTPFPQDSGAGSAKGAKALAMTRKFFGTDGIRGTTNAEPMTAETALRIGQAAGAHFLRGDHRHRW